MILRADEVKLRRVLLEERASRRARSSASCCVDDPVLVGVVVLAHSVHVGSDAHSAVEHGVVGRDVETAGLS